MSDTVWWNGTIFTKPIPGLRTSSSNLGLFYRAVPDPSCTPSQSRLREDHLVLVSCDSHADEGISPGLASVSKDEIESKILDTVKAGDHWSFKISKQM